MPPLKAPRAALVEFDLAPVSLRRACLAPAGRSSMSRTRTAAAATARSRGVLWEDASLQRPPRAAVHPQRLRRPPSRRSSSCSCTATARRSSATSGDRQRVAAQIARGQRQRRAGGAAVRRQCQRLRAPAGSGSPDGFARFLGEAGAAPGAAARRQAHAQDLRHPAGGDRRLQRRLRAGRLGAAQGRHRQARASACVLLDALYGEVDKYADWIARHPNAFFISAYTSSSAKGNEALQQACSPSATSLRHHPAVAPAGRPWRSSRRWRCARSRARRCGADPAGSPARCCRGTERGVPTACGHCSLVKVSPSWTATAKPRAKNQLLVGRSHCQRAPA